MIRSFACVDTDDLFHSRAVSRFRNIERVARRKLLQIHAATELAGLRDRLIAYNADDCEALSLVARTIVRLLSPEVPAGEQERKRGQTRNGRSGQAGAGGRRK